MSQELQEFLTEKGVAMSHTAAYIPAGNGQVEKYNGNSVESCYHGMQV